MGEKERGWVRGRERGWVRERRWVRERGWVSRCVREGGLERVGGVDA